MIHQQGRAFTHGFEIHLEKATLVYDFSVIGGQGELSMPLTVLDGKCKAERPKLGSGDPLDAFKAQLTEVKQSVEANRPSAILGSELARDAVVLCQKQTQAVQSGRPVKV